MSNFFAAIQVEKQKIHIDPTKLFSRLIAIMDREEDMKLYFDYELSSFPTSLFKDGFMCKGVKSQLANFFTSYLNGFIYQRQVKHLIDGGALLHQVK